MSFAHLKRRVERSEALVEGRVQQANESQARLKREWLAAWTPLRIVAAGLGAGLVTGRLHPEQAISKIGKVAGPGSIQLLTSTIGLVGSLQAAMAAMTTSSAVKSASDTADEAAQEAAQTADHAADQAGASAGAQAPSAGAANATQARAATPGAGTPRPRDQRWDTQPSPAEAATEVSER